MPNHANASHNLLALGTGMDRKVLLGLLVTSAAVFMRLAVSLNPYSGKEEIIFIFCVSIFA